MDFILIIAYYLIIIKVMSAIATLKYTIENKETFNWTAFILITVPTVILALEMIAIR